MAMENKVKVIVMLTKVKEESDQGTIFANKLESEDLNTEHLNRRPSRKQTGPKIVICHLTVNFAE